MEKENINKFVEELNEAQANRFKKLGYINECFFNGDSLNDNHKFNIKEKKKYIYIDCDNSGYFMIVRETGEIFGVKAYGTINKGMFYGRIGEVKGEDVLKNKMGEYF